MKKIFQFAILAAAFAMTACVGKVEKTITETVTDSLPWYEDMEALDADLNTDAYQEGHS